MYASSGLPIRVRDEERLAEGMKDEAFRTAWGANHVTYDTKGYWFRTPEAWDISGRFRASMAMRPGAIWAIEAALSLQK
jgi:non-lysosomal glucosylceramidase